MDWQFIQIIKEIADQNRGALFNAPKLAALLSDRVKNEFKRECRLLQIAVGSGVGRTIYNAENMEICRKMQINLLRENYFMDAADAIEIVDFLAFVLRGDLGKIAEQNIMPISVSDPVIDSIPDFAPPPLQSHRIFLPTISELGNTGIVSIIICAVKSIFFGMCFGTIWGVILGWIFLSPRVGNGDLAFAGVIIGVILGASGGAILREESAINRWIVLSIPYSIISAITFAIFGSILLGHSELILIINGVSVGAFLAFVKASANMVSGKNQNSIIAWTILGAIAGTLQIPLVIVYPILMFFVADVFSLPPIFLGALTGAILSIIDEKFWERELDWIKHRRKKIGDEPEIYSAH
ncbi:hypothetical protein FACS189487_05150 [Campylobacterota bacterium]|nr:hypothetical protein FACS189487_05150 [Campylobacterota bacterium]